MAKARAKSKAAPKASAPAEKSTRGGSPFKTRKTREPNAQVADTLTPPEEVGEAIDKFRECQEQAKHFEGEATVQKDMILDYAQGEYTKRVLAGIEGSFKVLGIESMVTFVAMDASAGLTEEERDAFAERWGDAAAEALITNDLRSIRFDPEVLEANYDAVVKCLEKLPPTVLENLFKPMLLKAKAGAVEKAKQFAKTPEDLRDLIEQLKIKNYIR